MKLSEHVDKLRNLIEAAFDKHFARLGIGKNKQLDIEKLPVEVRSKRLRFEEMLESHIGETGDYEHARAKLIDELCPGVLVITGFSNVAFKHFFETQPFGPDFYRKFFNVQLLVFTDPQPGEMFIKSGLDKVAELVYMF